MGKWTYLFVGFTAGILIMALLNGFMVTDRKKEMQEGMQQEMQLTDLHEEESGQASEKGKEIEKEDMQQDDISESEAREESAGNSVRVFNSMEISQDFINEMMLYQYVEYGIRKYNESNGDTQRYSVNIQDMLPYDAQFCMNNENEKPFKTDLAKEMIPELSNNLYNFVLENETQNLYMSIDTYNMKIYVYDNMVKFNPYSCVSVEEGFEVTFYSRTNKIIFSECYPQEPVISQVADNIFEVSISVGSPATYIFYVDTENGELSETFFNPLFFGKHCVAYMEDGQLVLRDIFNKDLLYMTMSRDFTRTANPMSAIISIEMQDGGDVVVSYYKGENFEETSEIITVGSIHSVSVEDRILEYWVGEYEFRESVSEPSFMMMDYRMEIYRDNDTYYADIEIDGQTTLARIRAKTGLESGSDRIELVFCEYLPGHVSGGANAKEGEVLLVLERKNGEILTHWGKIVPMLYENEESGKVYFVKNQKSDDFDR